jgi:hypothetical protein
LNLTGDLAYKALDKLADNSQQWDFTSCRDKSARIPKKGGILELKGESELTQKMDAIVRRLDALRVEKPVNVAKTFPVESCSICASPMHQAQNCPSMRIFAKMEQVNAFNDFQKQSNGPYSETYNPGWKEPPKFLLEAESTHHKSRRSSTCSKSISSRIFYFLSKSWTLGSASNIILTSPHSSPSIIDIVIGRYHEGLL